MAKIVIKKKIDLAFLGDEYTGAQLVFRSVPVADYRELLASSKQVEGEDNELKDLDLTINTLKKYFVSGTFPDEEGKLQDLTVDDVAQFDQEIVLHCFKTLTGQNLDPKAQSPSTTPSTTEPPLPTNS